MAWKNNNHRAPTAIYQRWRLRVLRRDRFTCQLRYPGCTRQAQEVDHITPITLGGSLLDPHNGQAVCKACHAVKTRVEWLKSNRLRSRYREPYRHPSEGLGVSPSLID